LAEEEDANVDVVLKDIFKEMEKDKFVSSKPPDVSV